MIDKKIIDPRLDSVIADLDKQLINSKPIIRWRVHFLNKSKQSIKPKPVQILTLVQQFKNMCLVVISSFA